MPVHSLFPSIDIPAKDVASLLFEYAQERCDKNSGEDPPLLVDGVTGEALRFADIKQMAEDIAGELASHGFSFEQASKVAAVFSPSDIRMCPIYLGVLLAGGAYTVFSPDMNAKALTERLQALAPDVVFVAPELLPQLNAAISRASELDTAPRILLTRGSQPPIPAIDALESGHWSPPRPPSADELADRTALIPYTSGTTGRPKGVALTHRNIVSLLAPTKTKHLGLARSFSGPSAGDTRPPRALSALPLSGGYGNGIMCHHPLYSGICCVQLPSFDVAEYLAAVQKYSIDCLCCTPSMLHTLLCKTENIGQGMLALKADRSQTFSIGSVTSITCGGAHTPPYRLQQYSQLFGGVRVDDGYGQSETGAIVTGNFRSDIAPGAIGVLRPNNIAKIIDPDGNETSGFGELCVWGPSVMKGYLNGIPAPLTADGFLRTGDYARLDQDGNLFLRGRVADIIHTGGGPIYPVDIEDELAQHPDVEDAAVVGAGPAGSARPLAFIILAPEAPKTRLHDIEAWIDQQLGVTVACHETAMIPKSPAGKILRKQLQLSG
ncbi:4-coumarate--CoA ligase [Coemansia sp. RSA 552]|nr:4-coumarate--CoA ligase [Coemansia sp. RSA 552]